MKNKRSGFTLIELVIVVGIALILFGFITLSLTTGQRNISVNSSKDSLISDLSIQQTKAMKGSDGGSDFGVYFESDRYILFRGSTYSPTDPQNFSVMLDQNIIFSNVTFPGSTIIFSIRSGEVSGFLEGSNTVTIRDNQGTESKNITVNRYGVVTEVN